MDDLRTRPFLTILAAAALPLLADAARAGAGTGDAVEIQRLLREEPGKALVIDVRTVEEWNMGHIPGSVRIGMHDVTKRLADIPPSSRKTRRSSRCEPAVRAAGRSRTSSRARGIRG